MVYQDLLILTAPPASGKTFWITNFTKVLESQPLVISPLRALANECLDHWGSSVMVKTPEEWTKRKVFSEVVIIDEFHLWFYWGSTFRPLLWEVFYELVLSTKLVVLLSATLSSKMMDQLGEMRVHFNRITWIDFGNQRLKFLPRNYIVAKEKKWLLKQLIYNADSVKSTLVFCEFRNQVSELERWLSSLGFKCISCVGGEAELMKEKLSFLPTPDFIISTTVLSHGVNLPHIKRIFFLYRVENPDFWLQMIARGGRRGEAYDVFALEKPFGIQYRWLKNLFFIFYLTVREKFSFDALLRTLSRIKMRHDF
jgi:ATP-dependent DNA helicase RecQ